MLDSHFINEYKVTIYYNYLMFILKITESFEKFIFSKEFGLN